MEVSMSKFHYLASATAVIAGRADSTAYSVTCVATWPWSGSPRHAAATSTPTPERLALERSGEGNQDFDQGRRERMEVAELPAIALAGDDGIDEVEV